MTFRRLAWALQRVADRVAHPRRRRAAGDELRAAQPRAILVLCHGNLCRSPYAAALLQQRLQATGTQIRVESAGFLPANRTPPADALLAAQARGIDLATHRSRALTPGLVADADLIVVMGRGQSSGVSARQPQLRGRIVMLGDLDPEPIETRDIADPFGAGRAAFDACYARIDRCVDELLKELL